MADERLDKQKESIRLEKEYRQALSFSHQMQKDITAEEPAECIAGAVLQGHRKPHDCPAFGIRCTPERPLGGPMVSAEGA